MAHESDIDIKTILMPTKNPKKQPRSPTAGMLRQEPKKISTKLMIHQAMVDLTANNRKGVSLHAIKKYMVEKYNVDTDKINFYIKKNMKLGVEDGTIVQVKGIGASGSFRLAPKKKAEKKEKKPAEIPEKLATKKIKITEPTQKSKQTVKNVVKNKDNDQISKSIKTVEIKEKTTKKVKENKAVETKTTKASKDSKVPKDSKKSKTSKTSKETTDPAKKRANMMKRKSVGSIIKAPKMKPKSRQ